MPLCFVRSESFDHPPLNAGPLLVALNMTTERECEQFTPWLQGYTPKDHKDMMMQKELLAYQERQAEKDRKSRVWIGVLAASATVVGAILGAIIGALARGEVKH